MLRAAGDGGGSRCARGRRATITTPQNGSSTSSTRPSFGGGNAVGGRVTVKVDGVTIGTTATVDERSGAWSFGPLSPIAEGTHTVRASDSTGESAPSTFTIDTTAPAVPVLLRPANGQRTPRYFTYSGTAEPGTFAVVIVDGVARKQGEAGADGAWSAPSDFVLAEGRHDVRVQGRDAAGNASVDSPTSTFIVDTTPPDAQISSGPGLTASRDVTFTFSGTDPGGGAITYSCGLYGTLLTTCSSPFTLSGVRDGRHEFVVRATDAVGNTDQTPASWAFTVDTTAPETFIGQAPPPRTNATIAELTFWGYDLGGSVAKFECGLDGGAFATCTSPMGLAGLSEGEHRMTVRAVDAAGNVDEQPAEARWTVDLTAPDTAITGTIVDGTNARIDFSASDPPGSEVRFECALDGAAFSACTSPVSLEGLSAGRHDFAVRAIDDIGNADGSPAVATIAVAAPPVRSALPPPPPPRSLLPLPLAASDVIAPVAKLSGSRSQRLSKTVFVVVSCPSEACNATVSATIRVPKVGKAKAKTYRVNAVRKSIARGTKRKLAPPLSSLARRAIRRSLKAGKRIIAKLTITITDEAGNKTSLRRQVRLTSNRDGRKGRRSVKRRGSI